MPETMKAVVKPGASRGAEIRSVDVPRIKANEVLVRVKAASICGTDVHIYQWNDWAKSRIKPPIVMGHELAGAVVDVGPQVRAVKIGDFVSAETHIPCGTCFQCTTGLMHICANLKILGVDTDGCFAEYVAVPDVVAWKNDPSIPPEFGSVQEPLGNAVYATLVEDVAGKTVAIFGDGPTGLFATGVARVSGATRIFMIGENDVRMEIARKMGADRVLFYGRDDILRAIYEDTGGIGADVVLEMAGADATIELGFKSLRKGGRFTAFGIPPGPVRINFADDIIFKGATIYGISGREMFKTWHKTANLLKSKRLDISPIITHRLPLEDFEKGFALMMARPRMCGKVVLLP